MEEITLKASKRNVIGKQVNALRREGILPAVVYGRRMESIPISLDMREASRILDKAATSALIVLEVDGEKYYTLVREKQRNPVLGTFRHIDFQAVSLTEKVRANVAIQLVGEAPAVDTYFGILVSNLEKLSVESLPKKLPERIEVDLSNLKEIGDALHVRDLVLPEGVEALDNPDEMVVVVIAPVAEEVIEAEEAAFAPSEPELVERSTNAPATFQPSCHQA
jgi:large subunit ribosomal protein L25